MGRMLTVDNSMARTLHNVQYRVAKFKALAHRNQLYVEARADVAHKIVAACLAEMVEVVKADTMLEVAAPSLAPQLVTVQGGDGPEGSKKPEGSRVVNPSGKCIRFDAKRSCYEITYVENVAGEIVLRRSIKGLLVKYQDRGGRRTPEQCDEQMVRAFERAKKLWNESDQSGRERFE